MRRWPGHWLSPRQWPSRLPRRVPQPRGFHSQPAPDDSVEVACGSSGTITVDLHNVFRHPSSAPLVIYIPPFAPAPGTLSPVPRFLHPFPTAVVNYRWSAPVSTPAPRPEDDFSTPLQWPTPIHDVLAGYSWITENLRPDDNARRDLYVYSSHAGASLAASLALTESHHHERMAVRGLVAWNGIFNWSMFLPDHKINKPSSRRSRKPPPRPAEGSELHLLQLKMTELFRKPADLLDPFASPVMFFQTPGMIPPPTFTQAAALTSLLDRMSSLTPNAKLSDLMAAATAAFAAPRRSALLFPPRKSTLKLPEALFLYDAPPVRTTRKMNTPSSLARDMASRMARRRKTVGHTFEAQALELSGLMRRSLEKIEFKERLAWDEDFDDAGEIRRRVKIVDVGMNERMELGERGQDAIREWLEERICL